MNAVCRECGDGKHRNCDGTAWDEYADSATACDCPHTATGDDLSDFQPESVASHVIARELPPLGDAVTWDRKEYSVDITPVVSVSLASWGFNVKQIQRLYDARVDRQVRLALDLATVRAERDSLLAEVERLWDRVDKELADVATLTAERDRARGTAAQLEAEVALARDTSARLIAASERLQDQRDALTAPVAAQAAVIEAVRALHKRNPLAAPEHAAVCTPQCRDYYNHDDWADCCDDSWPCPTAQLLPPALKPEQKENLRLAVAQAYTDEGVRLWWESHRKADAKRRARMEAGVLAEYMPEVAPEPEPAAVPCDLCGSPTHSTRDCPPCREIQGNWPAPEHPTPVAGTDTEEVS